MNKVISELCRILDFSYNYADTAIHEAINKEKLLYTYMFVNGTLSFVRGLDTTKNSEALIEVNGVHKAVTIDTLEVFLPETGLYEFEDAAIYVEKFPKKQWKKSCHPDFYFLSPIKDHKQLMGFDLVAVAKKTPFFIDTKSIYTGKNKIGTVNGDTITLLNFNFYQDVLDWITKEKLEWKLP